MIKSMMKKTAIREIRDSLGRYFAILAIVALGVGFFCGLKVTRASMISTAEHYLSGQKLFDFELISTLGYDDKSVGSVNDTKNVAAAEGSISKDVIVTDNDIDRVFKAMSITDKVNKPSLKSGRMPESDDECVADSAFYSKKDIGKYIKLSGDNDTDTSGAFKYKEYKITGTVASPLYLNFERGSSDIGNGNVSAYFYINKGGFKTQTYTEIYVRIKGHAKSFTGAYDREVKMAKSGIKIAGQDASQARYDSLVSKYKTKMQAALPSGQITAASAAETSSSIEEPKTYILGRDKNVGYSTFESNSDIVDNVAKVFPVFFFLVAALVCMTTITRMIDEQRTQIGVLRALGYSNAAVLGKYMFYSGSAATIGAIAGFLGGSKLFPSVIWDAYKMMYDFSDNIDFILDKPLGLMALGVALVCSMGATWISCAADFREAPAQLIRPKAPKSGKRILIERLTPVWKRISFLYKVSLRNIFRYKKRFFMMVLGICGCTALLIAGFGINTTVRNIAEYQFNEISRYDYQVSFTRDMTSSDQSDFRYYVGGQAKDIMFAHQESAEADTGKNTRTVTLISSNGKNIRDFIDIHSGNRKIVYPGDGEAVVCRRLQKHEGVNRGDKLTLRVDDKEMTVKVVDVCDNYVYDYIYINDATYENGFGKAPSQKTAYISVGKNASNQTIRSDAAHSAGYKYSAGTQANIDMLDRIGKMMTSLNAVVVLVILSAGLLAFIVLYNLTNINITERIREIATIEVLGFYPGEISSYVFRENFFLTAISAVVGIPVGKWLLDFVIDQINVDLVFFDPRITVMDYCWSVALTFVFAVIVNLAMYPKLSRISMTESLKSTE